MGNAGVLPESLNVNGTTESRKRGRDKGEGVAGETSERVSRNDTRRGHGLQAKPDINFAGNWAVVELLEFDSPTCGFDELLGLFGVLLGGLLQDGLGGVVHQLFGVF